MLKNLKDKEEYSFKVKFHSLGRFMATFDPLLCRIFLVSVLKRGCPGNMASSGKKREHDDPLSGVGRAGGSVKSQQPSLQTEQISYTCNIFHKKRYSENSSHFLCCSIITSKRLCSHSHYISFT